MWTHVNVIPLQLHVIPLLSTSSIVVILGWCATLMGTGEAIEVVFAVSYSQYNNMICSDRGVVDDT